MSTPKDNPSQSRFWDQFNTEDLRTTNNFKALFRPTEGGGSNAWPNKRVKISAQITDKMGKSAIEDLAVFYISKVITKLSEPTAELQLHALSKPLQKVNAEKVKNGTQWWENVPISFLINRLLELVYKGKEGELPEDIMVSRQDLAKETEEQDYQLWNLGVPPNWDGTTFQPSPNANPVTAMVKLPGTGEIVVGLGGFDDHKAELWRYDVTLDTWTKIGQNGDFKGPIQSLVFNEDENLVYGVCWDDPTTDERSGQNSGHKWLAPDAKIFWVDPLVSDQTLDDSGHSIDVPDFFPGTWDVREMFPLEYGAGDLPENSNTPGELGPFLKDDFKASVGNFEAVEQVTIPVPGGNPLDRSSFPLIDDQDYAYEQDPLGKEFFPVTSVIGQDQKIKTINGQTQWIPNPDAVFNMNLFTGLFSIASSDGDLLSFISTDPTFSMSIPVDIKYAYRLRITGFTGPGWTLSVLTQIGGDDIAIISGESLNSTLQDFFLEVPYHDSGVASLLIRFAGPINTTITIKDISIVPAINTRIAERVGYQAGENIPITHFSKVAVGVYNQKPTNNGVEGPKYDLYNGLGETFEPLFTNLRAVSFISDNPDIGFIGDNKGAIFRTMDGGLKWTRIGGTDSLRNINDMYFFDSNLGWIVGDNGNLFRSTDASSIDPSPIWSGIQTEMDKDIRRIDFFNSDVGWFVGNSGSIYKTVDGGLNWNSAMEGVSQPIEGFDIIDIDTVVAVRTRTQHNGFRIYKTINQGAEWTYVDHSLTSDGRMVRAAGDVVFISSSEGYFAGAADNHTAIWKTADGGETWDTATNYLPSSAAGPPFVTRLRPIGNYLYYTTNHGRIYRLDRTNSNKETNLELLFTHPEDRAIRGLWIIDANQIVAVGDGGMVLRTTDGGQNWGDTSLEWRAEEVTLDFNLIAQDRVGLLGGDKAFNPLFGPSDKEAGISVDNSVRRLIGNTFGEAGTNDFVLEDVAPAFDYVTRRSLPWVGYSTYNADPQDLRSGEAGNGYLSVVARTIGNKGGRWRESDELPLQGAVRYTNGQQGLFQLVPEADGGQGALLFTQRITDNDPPESNERYKWGPGTDNHRFKTKLVALKLSDKSLVDVMDLETTDSPNPGNPYNEQTQFPYPTAGAATEEFAFVSLVTNPVYTNRFTGNNFNEVSSINRIHKLDLSNLLSVGDEIIYDSQADQSLYNTLSTEEGAVFLGNVVDSYALEAEGPAAAQNRTRKILELHYSERFQKLFGSCFRKDSLLTSPAADELTPPCHEVFYTSLDNNVEDFNRLIIIDHDVQDGQWADAVKFTAFSEQDDRIWYFRLSSPTVDPYPYQRLGKDVNLCYINKVEDRIQGGNFWDDQNFARTAPLRQARKFISHNKAVVGLASVGDPNLERHTLLSSFDYYFRRDNLTQETLDDIVGRPKIFFKVDTYGLDKRIELADFRGMKVWDAIKDIANANDYVFGFNKEKFFITPRSRKRLSRVLYTSKGDIIDIEKEVDEDIRNIVTVSAYSPQLDDGEWEVTHVGRDGQNRPNNLEDERLFNGEFSVNITSHEEGSVLMICTRRGRLLTVGFDAQSTSLGDAKDHIWTRTPPLFKWLTHSPSINIVLMQEMGADDNELLVNTLYQGAVNPIRPGDIVIFIEQEGMEPVGKIIEFIDPSINLIRLEEPLGFNIEKFTNLNVIRSHLGSEVNDSHNSTVRRWGDKFSDEGVAVIKDVYRAEIGEDKSNRVISIKTRRAPGTNADFRFIEVRFQKPHGMSKGDTFRIVKGGEPDFRFAGEYKVFTTMGNSVFTEPDFYGVIKSFTNADGSERVFLVNEEFKELKRSTVLRLNSLNAFRGVRVDPYSPEYRHFNFLITTLPTGALSRADLPSTNISSETEVSTPVAYIHGINFDTMEIDLGLGDYSPAFQKGDVINAHYILSPTADKTGNPPYLGLSQQIPGGFANWRWITEPRNDLFNLGDVIRLKFGGSRLEKDASSTYSLVNSKSIGRWGEQDFTYPDNRFIEHREAMGLARMIINRFAEPGLRINLTLPFTPGIGFMTKSNQDLQELGVVDQSMFSSTPGFRVTGTLRFHEVDLNRKIMEVEIVTKEKY